jgi:hypothetical protein
MDLKTVELPAEADYGPAEQRDGGADVLERADELNAYELKASELDADELEADDLKADKPHAAPEQRAGQRPPAADDPVASDSWREALPELRAMWQRHLERWPEVEQPPADRSGDEPGSWRGDGGQYLNKAENLVASHELDRVRSAEKAVSPALREVEAVVPGASLVGFENRLKGEDRFKEKVAEELYAKPGRSVTEITDRMPDVVRYTCEFSGDGYVAGYWAMRESLTERGYKLLLSRNSWEDDEYNGINTRWMTADRQRFEVQFHTPESFQAKQLTHHAYERLRAMGSTGAELPELEIFQREVSSRIPKPTGVTEIPDVLEVEG